VNPSAHPAISLFVSVTLVSHPGPEGSAKISASDERKVTCYQAEF